MDFWKRILYRKSLSIDNFELFVPSAFIKIENQVTIRHNWGHHG